MENILPQESIDRYIRISKFKTTYEKYEDDWNAYDISGGNYDDAYSIGADDSDILNARVIVHLLNIITNGNNSN